MAPYTAFGFDFVLQNINALGVLVFIPIFIHLEMKMNSNSLNDNGKKNGKTKLFYEKKMEKETFLISAER